MSRSASGSQTCKTLWREHPGTLVGGARFKIPYPLKRRDFPPHASHEEPHFRDLVRFDGQGEHWTSMSQVRTISHLKTPQDEFKVVGVQLIKSGGAIELDFGHSRQNRS